MSASEGVGSPLRRDEFGYRWIGLRPLLDVGTGAESLFAGASHDAHPDGQPIEEMGNPGFPDHSISLGVLAQGIH